jgi:hypothetical protein
VPVPSGIKLLVGVDIKLGNEQLLDRDGLGIRD